MQADARILARLSELVARGKEILGNHYATRFRDKSIWHVDGASATGWSTSVSSLLAQVFGSESIHFKAFEKHVNVFRGYEGEFKVLQAVLDAAREDLEGGYLFNVRGLVKAELLDDALSQAAELLKAGYKDPACILTGVSLEIAVKELTERATLPTGKLDAMNVGLCKSGAYNLAKQKQLTAWADLRNRSAHGDWDTYNEADVRDMLAGVQRFIADHL